MRIPEIGTGEKQGFIKIDERRAFMERLRQYFHLIVTAVICFLMGINPKKRGNVHVDETLQMAGCSHSQAWGKSGCRDTSKALKGAFGAGEMGKKDLGLVYFKACRLRPKKENLRMGGPGDRFCPDLIYEKAG